MKLREFSSPSKRRKALEKAQNIDLTAIASFSFDPSLVEGKNIENMIGVTQIPLGVAGPLLIRHSGLSGVSYERDSGVAPLSGTPQNDDKQSYYIPLATTEGALVASVSRGCKAVTESGGVTTHSFKVGTTRGPVFFTGSLAETNRLFAWVNEHEDMIKAAAEQTSSHLKFKKVRMKSLANYLFARFYFDTADAMGMNMVTIATQAIVRLIEKETGIRCLSVAGNFDVDKKPSWLNFIENRGYKVWAEAIVTKKNLTGVLKTTAEQVYEVWLAKCMLGSAMSGSLGFNAHYANIIAATFIATGQDPAHVVEGSMGVTTARSLKNGDLYFSIYIPSLMIGTVGGGTGLPTQQEALGIMGVKGSGKAELFAEIIGGAVLAGELSLLASLSEGSLAKAHETLGRRKK